MDRLALAARQLLGQDPQSGALLVFVNPRANPAKVLGYEPVALGNIDAPDYGLRDEGDVDGRSSADSRSFPLTWHGGMGLGPVLATRVLPCLDTARRRLSGHADVAAKWVE